MKRQIVHELCRFVDMDEETLLEQGIAAFLRERKRNLLLEQREILSRYGVNHSAELEESLRTGSVPEHPAWEDLITLENIEYSIQVMDEHLRGLQEAI